MERIASNKPKRTATEIAEQIKSLVEDPKLVEQRRKQITKAAIAAFIRHGYHPCTIRNIAKQAQVSVGLIYQYVGDKEDLLFLALVEILRAYKEGIPSAVAGVDEPLQRFCTVVRAYCTIHSGSPDATTLAYRETASLSKERRDAIKQLEVETNQLIIDPIRACIAAGIFERHINEDVLCYQIVMFSHTWALKAWNLQPRMTLETYLEDGLRLMLGGVMTAKGAEQYGVLTGNAKP